MTREEALKVASEMHGWLKTDREKEALETLIPELKESEDERIIKTLQEYVKNRNWPLNGPTQDEVLAWLERQKECLADNSRIMKELISFLKEEIPQCSIKEHAEKLKEFVSYLEKQKYDRMKPIYDARESFESALEKAWNDYHNGYENVDKLEDDYVQCAHAKGFREGYLFGIEKRKPIISIDQLKSMMLQYLQEAANEKDDSDIEADTDKWARKILGYAFEQKPECDNETEVQKAYREGKNAGRKEVFDHPEYYGLQPRRMYDYETGKRNPEWSEEDKQWLSEVYFAIDHSMYSEDERQAMKKYIDYLRSQAKLKQERNEEDEKVRKWLLEYFYLHRDDLRGASVTSMEVLSFLDNHPGKENACDAHEFDHKPGEKFWVRCKTNKTVNLWFDKDDERPAYAVDADGIITYIVHIKKDGTGNCVSYQNKEKFLETFEIIEK